MRTRFLVAMVASLTSPVLFVAGLANARASTSSTSYQRSVTAKAGQGQGALATQPAWANRGPAVAGDLQGYVHAAWENTNGQLAVALRDLSGNWTSHNLGIGPLGSQPSEAATSQVYNGQNWHYVFWQGRSDNGLHMVYWGSNGQWSNPVLITNSSGQLNSQPAAAAPYDGGTPLIDVFWTGNDGHIHYMYSKTPWKASSWSGPFKALHGSTAIGSPSGAPAAAGNCNFSPNCENTSGVYWTADQNVVSRATYNLLLDTWTLPVHADNTSSLGSEPSAVSNLAAEGVEIAWRGSGGSADLFTMTDDYTSFTNPANDGMGPLTSAPAVGIIEPNGAVSTTWFFLWRGTNADLYDAREDSGGFHGPYDLNIGQICGAPTC